MHTSVGTLKCQLTPCGDGADRHHVGHREDADRRLAAGAGLQLQCGGEALRRGVAAVAGECAGDLDERGEAAATECLDESVSPVDGGPDARGTPDQGELGMPGCHQGIGQFA